ncbi:MAG TPA: nucleoside monophosphate kinase [Candidatus Saccharimonadales bacterium]|nr:nucleoside monophosphate kinase [Candidatus Saccharimonadales bacterium]
MIILFGVVGSGKSEQANRMIAKLKCPLISTSDLLRETHNPEWQEIMLSGKLVPDEAIFELLEPELKKARADKNECILDGAPRSIPQAEWLSNKIKSREVKLTAVIYFKVSKETTMKRLLNRGREDDTEEVIAERFRQYDANTMPVLIYLSSQGYPVYEINGELTSDKVETEIWQVLKDKVEAKKR